MEYATQKAMHIAPNIRMGIRTLIIAVLQLGKALRTHDDLERSRPDGGQPPAEILDGADVVHLVQDDVDRHLAALFRGAVGVAHELDEQEGEEQGRQELQGGVLIIQDDVIAGSLRPRSQAVLQALL